MKRPILCAVPLAAAILLSACGHKEETKAEPAPPAKVEEVGDADSVRVSHPDQFPLVDVVQRALLDQLSVNGVISPDVNRTVPVNALLSGRVTSIKARLGDSVKKGDVLLTVVSPDLELAFADFHKFQADEVLAKKALARAKLLVDHGAAPQKDVENAEDVEQKALVDMNAASERIRILGGDPNNKSSMFEILAPVSGTITAQNTAASASVKTPDNSPDLFTISDLSRVWVLCDVYENNLASVHIGDSAQIKLNAYPERTLRGRVSNIGQVLDPATRTAKVRLELDNPQQLFKPGMFATVTFYSQKATARSIIPATAILRLHDRSWVFLPSGGQSFRRVEVQTGLVLPNGEQEITGGLSPGDRIVKNALQLSSAAEQS